MRGGFEGENYFSGERRQESGLSPDHLTSPPSKRRRVVMRNDGRGLDGELQNGEVGSLLQDKKQRKEKKDKKRKKKKKKVSSSSDSDSDSSDEESKKKKKKVKKDKESKSSDKQAVKSHCSHDNQEKGIEPLTVPDQLAIEEPNPNIDQNLPIDQQSSDLPSGLECSTCFEPRIRTFALLP